MSKRNPSVEITFGGKRRTLKYDYEALSEIQDVASTYQSNTAHLKAIRLLVWAGLRSETLDSRGRETSRTLSIIEVGELLGGIFDENLEPLEGMKDEAETLLAAIREARGMSDPPKEENPTPPPADLP